MENYFAFDFITVALIANWQQKMLRRRRLRDAYDPLDVPVDRFVARYRMDQATALDIIKQLEPHLKRKQPHGLPVAVQVLCAVRFFASGRYQYGVGRRRENDFALSQSSVSRCIRAVSTAVCNVLLRQYIKFPLTQAQKKEAQQGFVAAFGGAGFPRTIGVIDSTHITIKRPSQHEELYYSPLGGCSIKVQLVSDANMRIISIVPRYGGARHDSFIWEYCQQRRAMKMSWELGDRTGHLVGDSGYPLEPWLMTPIRNADACGPEERYTQAHAKTRDVVERCFGLLKTRWRCLSDRRGLDYEPDAAIRIISCCATLHNICLVRNLTAEEEREMGEHHVRTAPTTKEIAAAESAGSQREEAERVRADILKEHFS